MTHDITARLAQWSENGMRAEDVALAAKHEIERLRAGGCARDQGTTQYCAEAAALAAENAKLRAALKSYVDDCNCCGGSGSLMEYDAILDKYLWRDCMMCKDSRAALTSEREKPHG